MKLNEQVNSQIKALTDRANKLRAIIRRVDYTMAFSGLIVLLAFLFPLAISPGISSLDIPTTLLALASSSTSTGTAIGAALGTESAISSLLGFFSTVGPFIGVAAIGVGVYNMSRGSESGLMTICSGLALSFAPIIFSTVLGVSPEDSDDKKYINDAIVRNIINFDESTPISQDYISKVSRVDERYVLAQAAILSEAGYPSGYFKSLAGDLSKESSFKPTEEAMYSIEMAAYGHPESEAVILRANTLNGYGKTADTISLLAQMMFVMLFIGGSGLKLLRMSINKRLKTIIQLVSESRDNSEVAR